MQHTLFPEENPRPAPSDLDLILSNSSVVNTKVKTDFRKALDKNQHLKKKVDYVKELCLYATKILHSVLPAAEKEYATALLDELIGLSKCYDNRLYKFTVKRKEALKEIVFDKAIFMYNNYHIQDAKEYIERYKPEDYDEIVSDEKQQLKDEFAEQYGIDLDMDDFEGEPDYEKLHAKYGEQFAKMDENTYDHFAGSERKKTKKQIERDEKRKEDEKLLNTDISRLFKQLALKLHPDKEQDELLKTEKEELMKRITLARDENDIFELLSMHSMIARDDLSLKKDILDEDSMKRLTKLIREKNKQLDLDIWHMHRETPGMCEVPTIQMNEDRMKREIQFEIESRRDMLLDSVLLIQTNIDQFSINNKSINSYIDAWLERQTHQGMMNDFFDDMFDSF